MSTGIKSFSLLILREKIINIIHTTFPLPCEQPKTCWKKKNYVFTRKKKLPTTFKKPTGSSPSCRKLTLGCSWVAPATAFSFERVNPVTDDSWPTYSNLVKALGSFCRSQDSPACHCQLRLLKLNLVLNFYSVSATNYYQSNG